MSILGNINKLIDDQDDNKGYTTPAVIRKQKEGITFEKAMWISALLHPTVVGLVALLSFILLLLGINLFTFERPKAKMNDIEFVLVDREATPINKKTPYRSDRNSQAGGKHDPKRKVSMPSPAPAKTQKASPAAAPQKQAAKPTQPKQAQAPKQQTQPKKQTQTAQQPTQQPTPAKPQPPSARPSVSPPATPKLTDTPKSPFTVPVAPTPNTGKLATGPVGGQGTSSSASGGGSYSPTPSLAPTSGGSSGSSAGRSPSSGGSGNAGNPGPGNPNGRPGIDAIREPDFGPYMRDLQRRIKQNWDPPKGNESKRVVLMFTIARDGRLLSSKVYKSSGMSVADNAALQAVQLTAPFKPLPPDFRGSSIDIQFTFDYNVFGAGY